MTVLYRIAGPKLTFKCIQHQMFIVKLTWLFCIFTRQLFVKPDGSMYEVDEILKRPRLANTLETIANEGADAFYTGSLAQDVVDDIKDYGRLLQCFYGFRLIL